MRGRKRPQTERAQAVGIALLEGAGAASRKTGIPERTIQEWANRPEFAELRARTKEQVAEEWWAVIQKGVRRVYDLLDSTEDVQKVATATAIVTDKMLLLRGEATSRTENRSLTDGYSDDEKRKLRDWIDSLVDAPSGDAAGDPGGTGAEVREPAAT